MLHTYARTYVRTYVRTCLYTCRLEFLQWLETERGKKQGRKTGIKIGRKLKMEKDGEKLRRSVEEKYIKMKKTIHKIKLSVYRPRQALKVRGCSGSQVSRQSTQFYLTGNIPGNRCCYRLSRPQGQSAAGIKNISDTIGNRTRIVSQPTAPPRAPENNTQTCGNVLHSSPSFKRHI
jgi:hypothetical protein